VTDDYFAGLFDGEGWFHVTHAKAPRVRRVVFQVHAALAIRQRKIVDALRRRFGGSTRVTVPKNKKHSPSWRWHVTGEGAAAFAAAVGPLLVIKKKQAALAVRFQRLKRKNKNGPCSDARFNKLARMCEQMQRLNQKGPSR